jgi:CRISPR type I-E-associated protein CasB/Cse2
MTSTTSTDTDRRHTATDTFVARIIELCASSPGRQADLRSGLGRPVQQCARMHRYLVPLLRPRLYPSEERAYYGVASLIAGRPRQARDIAARDTAEAADVEPGIDTPSARMWRQRPNLGASLAAAVRARPRLLEEDAAAGRLHLLTRQRADTVHARLPALTRHLLSAGRPIDIDWAVLLEDLIYWDGFRDQAATRWLQSFYRTLSSSSTPEPTTPESE